MQKILAFNGLWDDSSCGCMALFLKIFNQRKWSVD